MRNLLKSASLTFGIGAMILLSTVPVAKADGWDKKTIVTFSGPVEIPGKHIKGFSTLPAGTYVFKLLDSSANRHVVQIFDKDERKIYATILAIPNAKPEPSGHTQITFYERPSGEPQAIKAWFYPGDSWGQQFVYPKTRAKELAQTSTAPVLYSSAETSQEVTNEMQVPTPAEVTQMNQEDVGAVNVGGEDMELAQAVTPPPPANMQTQTQAANTTTTYNAPAPAPAPAPAQLPQTASPLGLVMFAGLLALLCAVGVRFARQS